MFWNTRVVDAAFVGMVRSANVLLGDRTAAEITPIAHNQADPEIALILGAAKISGQFLLDQPGADPSWADASQFATDRADIISKVMFESVWSEGITRVSAMLVAAVLIRNIPLHGDLRQLDLANKLKEEALAQLDRIIGWARDSSEMVVPESNIRTIYFSLDVDPTSVPEDVFVSTTNVLDSTMQSSTAVVPVGKIAGIWFFFSAYDGDTAEVRQGAVEVFDGDPLHNIVDRLATAINTQALSNPSSVSANLIAGASMRKQTVAFTRTRAELEALGGTFTFGAPDHTIQSRMAAQLAVFTVGGRRLSERNASEIISLVPFTVDATSLFKTELDGPNRVFAGEWTPSTNYSNGNLVRHLNRHWVCVNTHISESTFDSVSFIPWNNSSVLRLGKSLGEFRLPSLLIGTRQNFATMVSTGPHSILINFRKGTAEATINPVDEETLEGVVDTFHFRKVGSFSGRFIFRLSHTLSSEAVTHELLINPLDTAEEISLRFLNAIHEQAIVLTNFTESNILGVLSLPASVQIIGLRRVERIVRFVIDLLEVPANLQVATGTALLPLNEFVVAPRSISIEAKHLEREDLAVDEEDETANLDRRVMIVNPRQAGRRRSPALQSVFDRIERLQ